MKFTLGVLLLGAICGIALSTDCTENALHDFSQGSRQYGDGLLYSTHAKMSKSWLRVKTQDITWPIPNEISNATITYVQVLDQLYGNKGGCAFLRSGGPGSSTVTLHLKTQRGGAFDFIINIYGFGY